LSGGAVPVGKRGGGLVPRELRRGVGAGLGGATAGLAAGLLALSGHIVGIAALLLLFIPVLMWRRTEATPVVLLIAALLVEQYHVTVDPNMVGAPAPAIPITSSIPLFSGIGSLHIEPADILLLVAFSVCLLKGAELAPRRLRSPLAFSIAGVIAVVLLGLLVGAAHHFNLRVALQETRPYLYLAATFALTALLIRSRSAVQTMLWALVVAEPLKSLQGVVLYIQTRSWPSPPEALLGHEEAYFFALYILLVGALWLFDIKGALRKTATTLLPLVIFADLVNNRRAAWLILGGGLVTLVVIAYVSVPERRRVISRAVAVLVVAFAAYLPIFWNASGPLGQPAHAIKSAFSPDQRDQASDLYREQEDANLQYNIRQGGVTGKGFGIPIDYALPIVDIQPIDPDIRYIPHNGVLYQLMRMGLLGGLAFWSMLGCGILAGCRLARAPDKLLAAVGTLVACALVGYALDGATDQGFYFYRVAFATGALLGLAEAARHLLAGRGSMLETAPAETQA
jgi:O-antigen ligase